MGFFGVITEMVFLACLCLSGEVFGSGARGQSSGPCPARNGSLRNGLGFGLGALCHSRRLSCMRLMPRFAAQFRAWRTIQPQMIKRAGSPVRSATRPLCGSLQCPRIMPDLFPFLVFWRVIANREESRTQVRLSYPVR